MSGSGLEPIKLREKWYWEPLEITIPLPRQKVDGAALVQPVVVDWFDLPEWTYFWNPLLRTPKDHKHFFEPNLISLKFTR